MNRGPLSPDEMHQLRVTEMAMWLQNTFGMGALRAADLAEELVEEERLMVEALRRMIFIPSARPRTTTTVTIGKINATDFDALCAELARRRLDPPSQQ